MSDGIPTPDSAGEWDGAAGGGGDALDENTRARAPRRWAMAQSNLGEVYLALFHKSGEPHHLDDALEAVDGGLEEFRKAGAALYIEQAARVREKILVAKADSTPPRPPVTK
jgi:hypothetical protein